MVLGVQETELSKMKTFEQVEEFLRQHGWKYWGYWKCWRVFIKPDNPNEPPLFVRVNDDRTVDADEWDRIQNF